MVQLRSLEGERGSLWRLCLVAQNHEILVGIRTSGHVSDQLLNLVDANKLVSDWILILLNFLNDFIERFTFQPINQFHTVSVAVLDVVSMIFLNVLQILQVDTPVVGTKATINLVSMYDDRKEILTNKECKGKK